MTEKKSIINRVSSQSRASAPLVVTKIKTLLRQGNTTQVIGDLPVLTAHAEIVAFEREAILSYTKLDSMPSGKCYDVCNPSEALV